MVVASPPTSLFYQLYPPCFYIALLICIVFIFYLQLLFHSLQTHQNRWRQLRLLRHQMSVCHHLSTLLSDLLRLLYLQARLSNSSVTLQVCWFISHLIVFEGCLIMCTLKGLHDCMFPVSTNYPQVQARKSIASSSFDPIMLLLVMLACLRY